MSINVNVGGVWKQVTDPQCNIGGVWKKIKQGFCNIGGVWKQFYNRATYLYNVGVQNVPWTGTSTYATITFEASDINMYMVGRIQSGNDKSSNGAVFTNNSIDVTNYTKLCIDWSSTFEGSVLGQYSSIELATNAPDYSASYTTCILKKTTPFTRMTDILDISSMTGTMYVDITALSGSGTGNNNRVIIYNVWLE